MNVIGIPLRKPRFAEVTAAAVMGIGLWIACLGVLRGWLQVEIDRADAGALLLVVAWACIAAPLGIRVDKGQRHLAANLVGSALLLAGYEVARAVLGF